MDDFIRHGKIGRLEIGDSRSDVEAKLGLPEEWLGKTGLFGPRVHVPQKADAWFYYNGAVGLYFSESGVSKNLYIGIDPQEQCKVVAGQYPFEDWPLTRNPTMGEMKEYLIANRFSFELASEEDDYFLVEGLFIVDCFPFTKGRRLELIHRPISMLSRVLSPEYLPDYVKR